MHIHGGHHYGLFSFVELLLAGGAIKMNDKYAKEIAKELRLIRIELQKSNKSPQVQIDEEDVLNAIENDEVFTKAGERVTIK